MSSGLSENIPSRFPAYIETSADAVKYLAPHCVPPFFSGESFANVLKKAEALPAALSLSYMFERPVNVEAHPVDFFLWISGKGRRDILAGASAGIPDAFYAHNSWKRIRDFAREWMDESSPLYDVRSFWLEFDIRGVPQGIPVPLIFFTIEPHSSPEPALELLQDKPFASPQLANFRRCWEALPDTCRYRTAGVLYSRPTDAIRFIMIMTPDEAFRYLEHIRWPGSVIDINKRFEKFFRFHNQVSLHFDVHPEGIDPQVGMEIYVDEPAMYKGRGGDCAPLLDLAVEQSLCLPEIRDALVKWPGSDTFQLRDGQEMRVERMFHHIKLVSQPDLGLYAKAYTTAEYEVM